MSIADTVLLLWEEFHEKKENTEDKDKLWDECIDSITHTIKGQVKTSLTREDVRVEVLQGLIPQISLSEEGNRKGKIDAFIDGIQNGTEFTAHLFLQGVVDLPVGLRIGSLEIIGKPDEKELLAHIKRLEEKHILYIQTGSWAEVKFSTYRYFTRIRDELHKELDLPYSVLYLLLKVTPRVIDSAGVIYGPTGWTHLLEPERTVQGWSIYSESRYGDLIGRLSKITLSDPKSNLENRILRGIELFGLSRSHHRNEVRIVTIMAAFEAILLVDREPKARGIAEKTAFLLAKRLWKGQTPQGLYKQMKDLYRKRSDFVHGDSVEISEDDLRQSSGIFKALVSEMVKLSDSYTKMKSRNYQSDEEGVDDYIDRMKFFLPPS